MPLLVLPASSRNTETWWGLWYIFSSTSHSIALHSSILYIPCRHIKLKSCSDADAASTPLPCFTFGEAQNDSMQINTCSKVDYFLQSVHLVGAVEDRINKTASRNYTNHDHDNWACTLCMADVVRDSFPVIPWTQDKIARRPQHGITGNDAEVINLYLLVVSGRQMAKYTKVEIEVQHGDFVLYFD
jgi:hypothetical protein